MHNRIKFVFDEVAQKVSPKKRDIGFIKVALENYDFRDKSVLDVGCGIGDNLIYCVQRGANYAEGFDISGESIKLAIEKARNLPNVIFHKCSLREYTTEKKFDFILGSGIFEYFDDPLKALKKICCFLAAKGTIILLISKPIFIKRASFLARVILSRIPLKAILPVAKIITRILKVFNLIFKKILYTGEDNTYSMEQTIIEALMVPRYNIFHHSVFTDYLANEGFSVKFFKGATSSMIGIIATKDESRV